MCRAGCQLDDTDDPGLPGASSFAAGHWHALCVCYRKVILRTRLRLQSSLFASMQALHRAGGKQRIAYSAAHLGELAANHSPRRSGHAAAQRCRAGTEAFRTTGHGEAPQPCDVIAQVTKQTQLGAQTNSATRGMHEVRLPSKATCLALRSATGGSILTANSSCSRLAAALLSLCCMSPWTSGHHVMPRSCSAAAATSCSCWRDNAQQTRLDSTTAALCATDA